MTIQEKRRASTGNVVVCDALSVTNGTTGQVLQHNGTEFVPATISGAFTLSNATPAVLGIGAPGAASSASRSDHEHPTTGLALLAGATFTGGVVCNAGLTIGGSPGQLVASDSLSVELQTGDYFRVRINSAEKARFDSNALLIGHTTTVGSSVAIVMANNGTYGSLDNGGNPRSLVKLTAANDLLVGDELGPVYITAGSSGPVGLLVGGIARLSANNNDVTVTASTSGLVKFVFNATEKFRMHNDGGLLIGEIDNALGGVGIGIKNNAPTSFRNASDSAWIEALKLDSSDNLKVGSSGTAQVNITCGSSSLVSIVRGSTDLARLDGTNTSGETCMELRMDDGTGIALKRVKVATTADAIPTGGKILYVL